MFIESLARLNHYLKVLRFTSSNFVIAAHVYNSFYRLYLLYFQKAESDMTVVAFLIFPARTNNFNVESLKGQAICKQLRETVASVQKDIGHRLYEIAMR